MKPRNKFPKGVLNPDYKHGLRNHPLYAVWSSMRARCNNSNDKAFANYGGRGVKVCDEWSADFKPFYDWAMSAGYAKGRSIDRIDVNGNYEPNNCRFADRKTQNNNRRNNVVIEIDGRKKTLKQWSDELGKSYKTVKARYEMGYSAKDALFGILNGHKTGKSVYCSKLSDAKAKFIFDNKGKISQPKLSKMFGVSESVVYKIQKKLKWKHIHKAEKWVDG